MIQYSKITVRINYSFSAPDFRNKYKMAEKSIKSRFPKIEVIPDPIGGFEWEEGLWENFRIK